MALTSDEMNFLIYRYLRESGFEHSAYAFGNESYVYKSSIDGSAVPPGALISFVQKGLQYVEIEAHINDDGTETLCDESFSVLRKHTCRVKQRKRIFDPYEPMESDYGPLELDDTQLTQLKGHLDMICCCAWHPTEPILATGSGDGTVRLWVIRPIDDSASDTTTSTTTSSTTSSTTTSSSASTTTTTSTSTTTTPTLRYEAIMETSTILKPAHLDKVTTVTAMEEDDGNRDGDDDGDEGDKKKRTKNSNKRQKTSVQAATSAVMASMAPVIKHNRSIVAMDWSPLGTHIATGCYDGSVRIWTRQGTLALTLKQHQAPISSVRYHPKGDLLLTASVDQSVIVWDAASGDVRHATRIHTAPVIDIDWRNDTSYATCGVDHMIHIINVGEDIPYRSLTQHTRDVNSIRFDPSGSMLASASDDGTVKIWKFDKDTTTSNGITEIPPGMGPSQAPLHDLKEHDREVSIVRWSPTGPGTKNPETPLMLASASLDTTIKLWDPVEGRCLLTLAKHIHPVTSLAFSPNGQYIASGSHDRTHIWATKDGTLLKTYKTDVGGVNDLSWDSTGHELAVMFSHPTAVVLHIHV